MTPEVRFAIVEDSASYRKQLVWLLSGRPGWRVVLECEEVTVALRNIPKSKPDLVLIDIQLPHGSGLQLLRPLKEVLPKTPLIMLTVIEDSEQILQAMKLGASAYILKRERDRVLNGIEDVLAGGAPIMSPGVAQCILNHHNRQEGLRVPPEYRLTPREKEVITLGAQAKMQVQIADILGISLDTVKNHFRHIYEKVGASSLIEVLVKFNDGQSLLNCSSSTGDESPLKRNRRGGS